MANDKHPFHYFDIGNTQTLKELPKKEGINI
jgi:secreted Zn-dependent insulinase-like peptidase